MYPRSFVLPEDSFFLFGPRGSGKTTFLEKSLKTQFSLELLSQENFIEYSVDAGLFRRKIQHLTPGSWVWIDEIQRVPSLLNEVHWGIESRKLKFALSGSSARKLKRAGVNLLGGRAVSKSFYPFTPQELGNDFSLASVLQYGSLPIVFMAQDKKQKLRAYVQTYLREEIQTEALVKDLPSFLRFLRVASLLHGQVLSMSSVARDCAVKRPTVENYFSIIEDTLLGYLLYPLDSGIRVKERRHPKFYWVDSGLVRAIREEWGNVSDLEKGALFEGLILMILKSYQSYKNSFDEISYWASADVEVDFVLKFNSQYVAVEVKSSHRFRPEDQNGLKSIKSLPNLKRRIVVYPEIDRQQTADGIEVMSFHVFCQELEKGLF